MFSSQKSFFNFVYLILWGRIFDVHMVKSVNWLNMVYIRSKTCSTCSNCQFFEIHEPLKIRIWQSAPHWLDYVWYIRCLVYSFQSTSWLIRYVNLLRYRDQIDFFLKKLQTQVWKCALWIGNVGLNSENMNFVCQVKYLSEKYWNFINSERLCLCLARVRMPFFSIALFRCFQSDADHMKWWYKSWRSSYYINEEKRGFIAKFANWIYRLHCETCFWDILAVT